MSGIATLPILQNGVFIGVVAHGVLGASLVWDKVLLRKPQTQDLLSYVFWLGALSVFGLALIPFGFEMAAARTAAIAFGAGVIHLLACGVYYAVLKRGEVSETLAVMGGFSPVATALIGIPLLAKPLGGNAAIGFALMTAGGFVMFFSERLDLGKLIAPILAASALFGLTNVLQKVAFDQTNFVTGYVFFTAGTAVASFALLIPRAWRQRIFGRSRENGGEERSRERRKEHVRGARSWYFVNRFISGVGSFLVFLAISRTNPAVVDAISGVRYAVIFLGACLLTRLKPKWLREEFAGASLLWKTVATALVVSGLVLLGLGGGGGAEA